VHHDGTGAISMTLRPACTAALGVLTPAPPLPHRCGCDIGVAWTTALARCPAEPVRARVPQPVLTAGSVVLAPRRAAMSRPAGS
jgi:hypothetical protein